jgi:DNA-binding transcriptional LysR family regulator
MGQRLTIRQAEAFRAVMVCGTVSGAARTLGLTQPAVSRLVRDMQIGLGLRLFERRGNALVPTAEAQLLHREVELSFVSLARIERTAQELRRAARGMVRISAMAGPALGFLPRIAAEVIRDNPGTYVALHANVSPTTLERVALRQFDLGLAYAPGAYPGLDAEELPGLEALCAIPASWPLAHARLLRAEDLLDQPLVSLGVSSRIWAQLEAQLRLLGGTPRVLAESTASEVLCELVAQGVGAALIDPFTATHRRMPGLVVRRLETPISYEVTIVTPSGVTLSRTTEDVCRRIRDGARMERLLAALSED